jgi:hypothetical protein
LPCGMKHTPYIPMQKVKWGQSGEMGVLPVSN